MFNKCSLILIIVALIFPVAADASDYPEDVIKTSNGDLTITLVGHGSLMFKFKGMVIHVDPFSQIADYDKLAKADLILVTHHHGDHLDTKAINKIKKEGTVIIHTAQCADKVTDGLVMKNGDVKKIKGFTIAAIPAYNMVNKRPDGNPFHPVGEGNGYVVSFADKRVYIAGDTENIPEMKKLKNIDIAFLPVNLPYTMTPEMVADAVLAFKPKILYPYHFFFGSTDLEGLTELIKGMSDIDLRVRNKDKAR